MTTALPVEIRTYEPNDEPAVLALLQASLGWVPDDDYLRFFRWKHLENPFGTSPAWVATIGGELAGFRVLLRWEFTIDGTPVRAVRAVDTATHPDFQGRGVFSKLTRHALAAIEDDGVGFVFNTPNEQSRPGYLKMGWQMVERVPIALRVTSPAALARIARARVAADKWSQPSTAGHAAPEVLANRDLVGGLLASQPEASGLVTRRSPEFYAWRYGFDSLHYRVVPATTALEDGFAVLRMRRRGPALEATVADVLVADGRPDLAAAALRRAARDTGADYALTAARLRPRRSRYVPLPRQGPTLVWRAAARKDAPPAPQWRLGLGDIELF